MEIIGGKKPYHPGIYIKKSIFPIDLTVKKAAEILGIGRPALSNLLNGKASLSIEMAMRMEKAFQIDSSKLLEMQKKYDEYIARAHVKDISVIRYVPPFYKITAQEISNWANRIEARGQLAALLRTLVHSTCSNLTFVDFPAFDNSQRRGWDGQVISDSATPWVPRGESGWEFGCDKNHKSKANKDFSARTGNVPTIERKLTTFVFVTPRDWPNKMTWANEKKDLAIWKDVRVYDANDLEQWIEQSIPAQIRILEFMNRNIGKVETLDRIWNNWAEVTNPNLPKELFSTAVNQHRNKLEEWLGNPPNLPFVITSDSINEALAFLNCAFEQIGDSYPSIYENSVVVRKPISNAVISSGIIVIVASSDVENDLGGTHRKTHTIIVRGKNMVTPNANITLDLLDHVTFKKALKNIGLDDTRISQLERESARSPTILRRRLAEIPEKRTPPWVNDYTVAHSLIPLIFVGAWDKGFEEDREILQQLTGTNYDDIERNVAKLKTIEESPIWSFGNQRGVFSKIDSLYAVHKLLTQEHFENFLFSAKYVLSEQDPALELPEDERWAASLYGKCRNHSDVLRSGLCDSLILLAVHGKDLIGSRLEINLEYEVSCIVKELLTPSTKKFVWLSHRKELHLYAEAAPNMFLKMVEEDLNREKPQIADLFVPTKPGITGECLRLGILRALEILAWNPDWFRRVVPILAKMCEWKIDDNWVNKPIYTLKSIFRSWMPQTSVSVQVRNELLEELTQRFPKVGWQVCTDQFDPNSRMGHYNAKPRWRTDGIGVGDVTTKGERYQFQSKAIELALNWKKYDEYTLGDLIKCFPVLSHDYQSRIWKLVVAWNKTEPFDKQKAYLNKQIRQFVLTERIRPENCIDETTKKKAQQISNLLKPTNLVQLHKWLFQNWIQETEDEIEEEQYDYQEKEKRVRKKRLDALDEIFINSGVEGIKEFCRYVESPYIIGIHMAEIIKEVEQASEFIQNLLIDDSSEYRDKLGPCISGFLFKLDNRDCNTVLEELCKRFDYKNNILIDLLNYAPFNPKTWYHVNQLPEHLKREYWETVNPGVCYHFDESSISTLVDELLKVNRPYVAFSAISSCFKVLDSTRLKRLLTELATNRSEKSSYYRITPNHISEALDILEVRSDITSNEIANLEYQFILILNHTEHGIRNLETKLSESPRLFMEALVFSFKRSDNREDPNEWKLSSKEEQEAVAKIYFELLSKAKRIPGTLKDGSIDGKKLKEWLREVRILSRKFGRLVVGDQMIGQFLSNSPADEDGVWPCEPVREALEEIKSTEISIGMSIGKQNSEGPSWRMENDDLESKFAEKYRKWSQQIEFNFPFTANMLKEIASSYERDAQWWEHRKRVEKLVF